MTNAELVRRYVAAYVDRDYELMASLRHRDWTVVYPQSGELVRGSANERAIMDNYPGGAPRVEAAGRVVGTEDRWAASPLGGVYQVAGEGENWWAEWRITYPDGRSWFAVNLIELRYGKVFRETQYWAEPFEAPAWRAQWVERVDMA